MLKDEMIQVRNPRLLNIAVYVIVLIMTSIALISLQEIRSRAIAVALCILFGLVHAFAFRVANTPRRLAAYFALQMLIVLGLLRLSYPGDVFNLFFYILGVIAVLILPTRAAIAWVVAFWLVDSASAVLGRGAGGVSAMLFYGATFMLTAVFGYALRQAEIARRENQLLLEELRMTQQQLQDLAVAEERTRLAREMHDSLGHRLTVAIVQLEGAQRLIPTDPERAARMIATMRDEMKDALAELRHTVTALRAPIVDTVPLEVALADLTQTFQQDTGILTHLTIPPGFPVLPGPYRLAFYRAAQEALTNIQRHAEASNAWLQLSSDDRVVTFSATDDGKGIDHPAGNSTSAGLLGLRERANQLGGELLVSARPGGGAQLTFSAPLPERGSE